MMTDSTATVAPIMNVRRLQSLLEGVRRRFPDREIEVVHCNGESLTYRVSGGEQMFTVRLEVE